MNLQVLDAMTAAVPSPDARVEPTLGIAAGDLLFVLARSAIPEHAVGPQTPASTAIGLPLDQV